MELLHLSVGQLVSVSFVDPRRCVLMDVSALKDPTVSVIELEVHPNFS